MSAHSQKSLSNGCLTSVLTFPLGSVQLATFLYLFVFSILSFFFLHCQTGEDVFFICALSIDMSFLNLQYIALHRIKWRLWDKFCFLSSRMCLWFTFGWTFVNSGTAIWPLMKVILLEKCQVSSVSESAFWYRANLWLLLIYTK